MTGRKLLILWLLSAAALLSAKDGVIGHAMPRQYFLKEETDRDWSIRISGCIPSLCGIYIMVFDSRGKMVVEHAVPSGTWSKENPLIIRIPKDGITGVYAVKILGRQPDYLGIDLPLSDLPEVYTGVGTIGHEPGRRLFFQVPEGVTTWQLGAYKGDLSVFRDGKKTASTKEALPDTRIWQEKYDRMVEFPVSPGVEYTLYPDSCFYFRLKDLVTTFVSGGWFDPGTEIKNIQWWKCK